MDSFRDIQTIEQVKQYEEKLTNGYPERPEVIEHLIGEIKALGLTTVVVAELCIGPGALARALCDKIEGIRYVGLDYKEPFLDYTGGLLLDGPPTRFVHADLTESHWPGELAKFGPFQVIVTLQSLHDVGGAEQVASIYRQSRELLAPDGLFINADLGTPAGQDPSLQPNRLTVEQHLYLLLKAGYTNVGCTYQSGAYVCCQGRQKLT